jgi:hypothetical protein
VKFFGEMCVLSFINSYVEMLDRRTAQEAKDEQGKKKCKYKPIGRMVLASLQAKFKKLFFNIASFLITTTQT